MKKSVLKSGTKTSGWSMRLYLLLFCIFLAHFSTEAQGIPCSNINWLNVGWTDGQAGNPSKIDIYKKSCGWSNESDPTINYNTAYSQGILNYCRPEIAFKEGVRLGTFNSYLCPVNSAPDLEKVYEKGAIRGYQHFFFHILGFFISFLTVFVFAFKYLKDTSGPYSKDLPLETIAGTAILGGLLLRLYFFNFPGLGTFLFEEMGAGLVYIDKMYTGAQSLTGATNMTYFLGNLLWKWIWGPGLPAARSLSTILNVLSILFLFLGMRKLTSNFSALCISALYSINIYGIYLSLLSIETSWPLFFACLLIYQYGIQANKPRSILNIFFTWVSISLGVLTYPGFTVWVAGPILFFLWMGIQSRTIAHKDIFTVSFSILIVFVPTAIFHFFNQAEAPFLKGGGGLSFEISAYLEALTINLKDIFWQANTYYLQQSTSFVESWYWGFFTLGFWRLTIKERRRWAIALAISILSTIVLSSLATNLPGMRRGILFLIPFYIFAGVGVSDSFQFVISQKLLRTSILRFSFVAMFTITLLLNALRLNDRENNSPYVKYGELLVHPEIDKWLTNENFALILDGSGSIHSFISDIFNAYDRFRALNTRVSSKNFSIHNKDNEYIPKDIRSFNDYLLLIEPKAIADYVDSQFCTDYRKTIKLNLGEFHLLKVRKCGRPFYER